MARRKIPKQSSNQVPLELNTLQWLWTKSKLLLLVPKALTAPAPTDLCGSHSYRPLWLPLWTLPGPPLAPQSPLPWACGDCPFLPVELPPEAPASSTPRDLNGQFTLHPLALGMAPGTE